MANYDSSRNLALRLITKKGESVTLRRFANPTTPDPSKPWKGQSGSTEDQAVFAVFLNFNNQGMQPIHFPDGTQVRAGDKQALIAAKGLTFAPDLEHIIVRSDGVNWNVRYVAPLDPGGIPVVYECWLSQ